ncbi:MULTISPECIES: V-type ATP synthase subunit F [unclassified Streptomyces]|uniref:V-type ATP synthase subunit F n=1 Tax=unclassified Streptomyces TaxID=2593676 RepID=UPI000F4E301F|nr:MULTISPECIES: V-type ATP synthase subunit F [unclassified Streptomyces]MDH6447701.1 vacuolar-type H+-ATPase subunit F/Vma7 [Streptomyces sp. SAI-119]MDH6501576.1 vacuolar-type H+-ATPase subunit F/Vma7 [Streptomyces sp. SAI-149]
MARVAAIGERQRVIGLAAVGVAVFPAPDPAAARAAWDALPTGVGLVILTPAAADALGPNAPAVEERLVVVMPP